MATSLLIVAMVPILKALTSVHFNASAIEYKTKSLNFALAKLDDIKAKSIYSYAESYTENNTPLGNEYICRVIDAAAGTNLKEITVSVGYDGNGNGLLVSSEIIVTLDTMIAKRW